MSCIRAGVEVDGPVGDGTELALALSAGKATPMRTGQADRASLIAGMRSVSPETIETCSHVPVAANFIRRTATPTSVCFSSQG